MSDDSSLLNEMSILDERLYEEMRRANGDAEKMVFILSKRLWLYERISAGLQNSLNKLTLSNMREGVANQILIWKIKKDTDEQFAQVISRIDQLEQKVDRIHPDDDSSSS